LRLSWPAICVALSRCCVFGAAFRSFFAKLKLLQFRQDDRLLFLVLSFFICI
jgi:hypothetical protein